MTCSYDYDLIQNTDRAGRKVSTNDTQEKLQRWLSPPDPWSNHNIAREAHHHDTATWFTQGDTFAQWKSTGSLLWVNGLRARLSSLAFRIAYHFRCLSWLGEDYNFVCVITTILQATLCILMSWTAPASSKIFEPSVGPDEPPSQSSIV